MFYFFLRRLAVMVPTLFIISILTFVIIQLPPGDYLSTLVSELQAQGEDVDQEKLNFLRQRYGLDRPVVEQYALWMKGIILHGDFGYSFEHNLPVVDVVGDQVFLSIIIAFTTILFTWIVSFPIGVYSATHQYTVTDHTLTFIGFLGLAPPNFLLALIFLYFANVTFGTSIGGLMDPVYLEEPWSWPKAMSVLEHLWIPVIVIGTSGTAGSELR